MSRDLWVTTDDNPFDPFTQPNRWLNYDCQMGYFTVGKLVQLSRWSSNLSDKENEDAINEAIHDLIDNVSFTLSRDGTRIVNYLPAVRGKTVKW